MKTSERNTFSGFTLVELAIAITVIASILTLVIAGIRIKERLEINQTLEQVANYNSAVIQFMTEYNGLPGDLWNAKDSFGTNNTSNGDGDNILEDALTSGSGNDETLLFWHHLALSGLINGSYDGFTDGIEGKPIGVIRGSIWSASTSQIGTPSAGDKPNPLHYSLSRYDDTDTDLGLFSTIDAFEIDKKYDDGSPEFGIIRAEDGSDESGNCVDGVTPNISYKTSNTSLTPCILHFYFEK